MKTVMEVPMGSRGLRITAKGPDMIGEIIRVNFIQRSVVFQSFWV